MKGIEADGVLESAWVKYVVAYFVTAQAELWRAIDPALQRILPEGSTIDANPVESAFQSFEQKMKNLDTLKSRAKKVYSASSKKSISRWNALVNREIGVGYVDATISRIELEEIDRAVSNSIDLIKTVAEEHFDDLKTMITEGVKSGTDYHSLRAAVAEAMGVAKTGGPAFPAWKIERIAVDQTLKLHGKIVEQRQRNLGVTHYFWRTVGDARVRPDHKANEGKRFSWDDPPSTGHPGEDIRCRCVADPDFSSITSIVPLKGSKYSKIPESRFKNAA